VFDAGYQSRDYKGNKVTGINNNGSATSQINFRGSEDLGGGLTANFRVETDWNPVSNGVNQGAATYTNSPQETTALSTFGNGELRIGVASSTMGALDFGAINFNSLNAIVVGSPYGTAIGGAYSKVIRADYNGVAVRADNSVRYTTPTFSGFNASLLKSNKQNIATAGTTMGPATNGLGYNNQSGVQEIGINYANGPLAVAFSNLEFDRTGVSTNDNTHPFDNSKTKLNTLAASYTIGAVKLGAILQTNKGDGATHADQSANAVSVAYTLGDTVLSAQVGSLNNKSAYGSTSTNGASVVGKTKSTGFGIDQNLSKRTALYARYEKVNDDANILGGYYNATASIFATPSSSTGGTRTLIGLGIRHNF
jgi:predicted porin